MKNNRLGILRNLFYTVLMFLIIVCFTACRTKFGGINGTGVELSLIKWLMILGVGLIVLIIIWFIYNNNKGTSQMYKDYMNMLRTNAQHYKEQQAQLYEKKKNTIENLRYRNNSSVYNQTKEDINNAKNEEEVDRIVSEWINYEKDHPICPLCKTEHSKTDNFCNYCEVYFEHPYPICPDCGNKIDYSKDIICSQCGFDWISFLENKLKNTDLFKVVNIEKTVINQNNLYKPNVYFIEGEYVYDTTTISDDYESKCEINHHGIIHISKHSKNTHLIYSAKLFNETHRIFEEKQKNEEMSRLRKVKEAEEFAKRQEEERIKKEQEQKEAHRQYMKEISERTGIILD